MRKLAVALAVMSASALAHAQVRVDGLDGWTRQDSELLKPQLDRLRALISTKSVDGTLWLSPDGSTQATLLEWHYHSAVTGATKSTLLELDRGVVAGQSKKATEHVWDTHRFDGDFLVGESTDRVDTATVRNIRRYGRDSRGVVYMASFACAGIDASEWFVKCETALRTLSLTIPDQVAIPATAADEKKDPIKLANVVGDLITVLAVILLIRWVWKRREKRALVPTATPPQ